MNTAQPIKSTEDLQKIKAYYKTVHPHPRNYLLIITGLNTALRISDILSLKWGDVYELGTGAGKGQIKMHIYIKEKKTGKDACIFINQNIKDALYAYYQSLLEQKEQPQAEDFIFTGQKGENLPITRVQAFRIIKEAAKYCDLEGTISCHSLRKTFGYHAWKQGTSPALLMHIYHHSSYQVTKCYLGIDQDEQDLVFQNIML